MWCSRWFALPASCSHPEVSPPVKSVSGFPYRAIPGRYQDIGGPVRAVQYGVALVLGVVDQEEVQLPLHDALDRIDVRWFAAAEVEAEGSHRLLEPAVPRIGLPPLCLYRLQEGREARVELAQLGLLRQALALQ